MSSLVLSLPILCLSSISILAENDCEFDERTFAQSTLSGGSCTRDVKVIDVDLDGNLDVLIANASTSSLALYTGTGYGDFNPAFEIALSGEPRGIAVGDVNSDGRPDVVVVSYARDSVEVLLSDQQHGLVQSEVLTVDNEPEWIHLSDINADGHLDIATANYSGRSASLLIGVGDGSFHAEQRIDHGMTSTSITSTDLNHDGYMDLICGGGGSNKRIRVLMGDALGKYVEQHDISSRGGISYVGTEDFDQDGNADIAVLSASYSRLEIHYGDGMGGYESSIELSTGSVPTHAVLRDINGDSRIDIAVANSRSVPGGEGLEVFLAEPGRTFAPRYSIQEARSTAHKFDVADFNDDGVLDFVYTQWCASTGYTMLGACPKQCGPDLNNDGQVNLTDVEQFLADLPDYNGDGAFNFFDVSNFLVELREGCG